MSELKVGDRVIVHDGLFGAGVITNETSGLYTVKCDTKLPNTYAWETDTSLFFAKDLKLEKQA
jgi:hypothetical protein